MGGRDAACLTSLPGDADVPGSKDKSGTTELPPCTSWAFEVGLAWKLWGRLGKG